MNLVMTLHGLRLNRFLMDVSSSKATHTTIPYSNSKEYKCTKRSRPATESSASWLCTIWFPTPKLARSLFTKVKRWNNRCSQTRKKGSGTPSTFCWAICSYVLDLCEALIRHHKTSLIMHSGFRGHSSKWTMARRRQSLASRICLLISQKHKRWKSSSRNSTTCKRKTKGHQTNFVCKWDRIESWWKSVQTLSLVLPGFIRCHKQNTRRLFPSSHTNFTNQSINLRSAPILSLPWACSQINLDARTTGLSSKEKEKSSLWLKNRLFKRFPKLVKAKNYLSIIPASRKR